MGVEKEGILMLYAFRVAATHRSCILYTPGLPPCRKERRPLLTVVCSCTDISASFASHFIDSFPHQTMNEVGR